MSEQDDDNIKSENNEEDLEEMMPRPPNKQRFGVMGGDDKFQRLVTSDEGRAGQENHANPQTPIEMDDLTGQQPPLRIGSEIVTEKVTTTTKHFKRPHGPSSDDDNSSKSPKTTVAPIVTTTKRLKPSSGPESPFHPDSPIKTTTSVPPTVHSIFPHGPKKQSRKKSEKAISSAKISTMSDTTTQPGTPPIHQIDEPSRRNYKPLTPNGAEQQKGQYQIDPSDLPHQHPNQHKGQIKSFSKLHEMAAQDQESDPRNVDLDSSQIMDDGMRTVDQPTDNNQAFDSFVVGETLDEPNAAYEEKYKKLRAWVDDNARMRPLSSMENTKENLSSDTKEVIDGIITKIDKHLSEIAKLKDIPQFENIKGDKNLERGNEFTETRMSPETERKIDEIFAREKPMNGQRMSKNLYETHPRSKASYDDGKWVYRKITPKRPPYQTKHRASASGKEVPAPDDKMMTSESIAEGSQQSQLPDYQNLPKSLDPVFAARTRAPEHSQEKIVAPSKPTKQSKQILFIHDYSTLKPNGVDPASKNGMSEKSSDTKTSPQEEEPDETVACSKEKDEDEDDDHVFKIMHLPLHTMSHGYYRESENEDDKNDRPFIHHKHRHHEMTKHKQSEDPLKQITEETEEMIRDLNKKHKHGKTERFHENETHPKDDSDMTVQSGKHEHFPQEQNQRFSVPNYSGSMRAAEDMQEDVMPNEFMEEQMIIQPDSMDQDMIGAPAVRMGLQEPFSEDLTHLGRFIPRGKERSLSLHSRDVSEQEKHKNIYFIGDGIKLPLNMKEHRDGSLHLSVDVKSLCNCKHCTSRKLENGTVIIEALPLSEQEKREHEMETQTPIIEENGAADDQTSLSESSEEGESLEKSGMLSHLSHHGAGKDGISKRSVRTIESLLDNEMNSIISKASDEKDDDKTSVPMQSLTREEIMRKLSGAKEKDKAEGKEENSVKSKLKIFTNVFDFMKNLMSDIQSKT